MDKILGGGELEVQDVQRFGLWTDLDQTQMMMTTIFT